MSAIPYRFSLRDPAVVHVLLSQYRVPLHQIDSSDPAEREAARERLYGALVAIGTGLTKNRAPRQTAPARSRRHVAQCQVGRQRLAAVSAALADLPRGERVLPRVVLKAANRALPEGSKFSPGSGSFKRCLDEARRISRDG